MTREDGCQCWALLIVIQSSLVQSNVISTDNEEEYSQALFYHLSAVGSSRSKVTPLTSSLHLKRLFAGVFQFVCGGLIKK